MDNNFKIVEKDIVSIYENDKGERLINARELHKALGSKRQFANWIKQRIEQYEFVENEEFICFNKFVKANKYGNKSLKEYYLTVDMAKELCMIENNEVGRKIRKYFIEVEKRYRSIIESPQNIFDVMHIALNQIEENEKRIKYIEEKTVKNTERIDRNTNEIINIKNKIDVNIQKDYCLASDIAEQLKIHSEKNLPHSNFIGAIARTLGMKISYKHYYQDEQIAVVPDISKGNQYYQVYYKPKAVKEIIEWFNKNKEEIEYKIIYERNTKNGKKGEVKEKGYRIEDVCYKVSFDKFM